MSNFAELSIAGRLATASDADWDEARAAWNLAVDQHPAAVAFAESADDVAKVLRFAGAHDLKVTAQGSGHGAFPLGPIEDAILLKTERMRGIQVDVERRAARVEAGALSGELGTATHAGGLSSLPGSSPDVGVIGFVLGGGLGWLGRRYGFACNRVTEIELVSAAGEVLRVDSENHSELFWALRGGGGDYAIVIAVHIALAPLSELYAGALLLPAESGADALRAYRDWAASVPEEVTSIARFLHLPPLPDVPEPIRDRPLLTLGAACIGTQAEGEALIAPLREIGDPVMDTFAQIPASRLTSIHMDPEQPVPGIGDHAVIRELTDEAIAAFVGAAGAESGSTLTVAELRQLGGALGQPAQGAGALAKLDADFTWSAVGVPMTPQLADAVGHDLDRLHKAMNPWAGEGGYFNFADQPCDVDQILPAETCVRLREVKAKWDPDGLIRSNHALAVATG